MPRACFALLCVALLPFRVGGQTVTKDAQAVAIAKRSLNAMGGPAALTIVKDSRASGSITVPGMKATFSIVLKTSGTKKARIEVQRPKGTYVRILNQGYAAIIAPDGKVRRLTANNTIGERVTHIPLFSLLAEQAEAEVELVPAKPEEAAAGSQPFVLQIVRGKTQQSATLYRKFTRTTFYADAATGLITKMAFDNLAENNDLDSAIPWEIVYSDYRDVSGVMVPFKQVTYMNGQLESELVLDSITFNVGVPDSEFEIRAEVANAK